MWRFAALIFLASPASGQETVTDAFGIHANGPSSRDVWAGWTEAVTVNGVTGRAILPTVGKSVLIYLGEKSLRAGAASGQVAALVLDGNGNLSADDTEVTLTIGADVFSRSTKNGIAARVFPAGTLAGQFHAGAAIVGQQSERADYQVLPDLGSLTASWRDDLAPFLTEDMHALETTPMKDRFGNRVLDGIGIEARLNHPGGAFTLVPMVTVAGVGQGQLLVRDIPNIALAFLNLGQRPLAKKEVLVTRPNALAPITIAASLEEASLASRLTIGPFLTDAGYLFSDGSPVNVRVTPRSGPVMLFDTWIFEGAATVLMLAGPGDYPLDVVVTSSLGVTRQKIAAPASALQ